MGFDVGGTFTDFALQIEDGRLLTGKRLTTPEDVAVCLVDLSRPGTYWMTGNVIHVDGGEDIAG